MTIRGAPDYSYLGIPPLVDKVMEPKPASPIKPAIERKVHMKALRSNRWAADAYITVSADGVRIDVGPESLFMPPEFVTRLADVLLGVSIQSVVERGWTISRGAGARSEKLHLLIMTPGCSYYRFYSLETARRAAIALGV